MNTNIKYILVEARRYRKVISTDQKNLAKISEKDLKSIYCNNQVHDEEGTICQAKVFVCKDETGKYNVFTFPGQECEFLCNFHQYFKEENNPLTNSNSFVPVRSSDVEDLFKMQFKKTGLPGNEYKTLPYFCWLFHISNGKHSWVDKITNESEKYSDIECVNNRIVNIGEEKLVKSFKKGSYVRLKSINTIFDMEFVDEYVYISLKYREETLLLRFVAQNMTLFKRYYTHTINKLENEKDYEFYIVVGVGKTKEVGNIATIDVQLIFGVSFNLLMTNEKELYNLREQQNELAFVKCTQLKDVNFKAEN